MRNLFEETITRFLADHVTPEVIGATEGGEWPSALWADLQTLGFAEASAPESAGGAGANWGDLYPVVRACGYHNLPLPLPDTMLVNWFLGLAGHDAVSGPASVAADDILTLIDGRAGGCLRNVPWGRNLDHVLAYAQGGDGSVSLVLMRAADAVAVKHKMNIAREPRDDLTFADAVPVVSAPIGDGANRRTLVLGGAMLRAAQMAGALERCLDLAITYAGERVQFGRPINKFQAVQQQLAVLAEEAAAMRIVAEAAFVETATQTLPELPIMAAKVRASEAVTAGTAIVHGVHGAIGFTYEHSLHFSTRRLWSWDSEYGSGAVWARAIGRRVCRKGSSHLWPAVVAGRI